MSLPNPGSDTNRPSTSPAHAANDPSAKDQAKDIAQTGKQAAGEVAHTAVDAAKDVASETKDRASDLYAQTKSQLGDQVVSQKGAVVEGLRSLVDQLSAMTDDVHEGGTAVDVASKARDQARSAADWLDGHEPSQIVDELRTLGRQQPGRFLLGALVAGVVAGRLTRGVVAVHTDDHAENKGDSSSAVSDHRDGFGPETFTSAYSTPASQLDGAGGLPGPVDGFSVDGGYGR